MQADSSHINRFSFTWLVDLAVVAAWGCSQVGGSGLVNFQPSAEQAEWLSFPAVQLKSCRSSNALEPLPAHHTPGTGHLKIFVPNTQGM